MNRRSVDERIETGREARRSVPRSSHSEWAPARKRPDPVALLTEQNESRLPWLVPIRHGRMSVSPFTFYRGTARIMASDLAGTPTSGLEVQLGGDAHLSNFGAYASPERQLVFDANDFDETLRGPWEWDLKRLAASFMIAGQHLGFSKRECRKATAHSVLSYREAMASFAEMGVTQLWYDYVNVDDIRSLQALNRAESQRRLDEFEKRAQSKTSLQALKKLAEPANGSYQIRSVAPVLFPLRELPGDYDPDVIEAVALDAYESYKTTLNDDRRWMLDHYHVLDIGVKVVGVGSVGTRCLILLLEGRDNKDPLFLQAKEATDSVLEEHLGASPYGNHGERVVEGQRLVQAQADILLGWTEGYEGRQYYLRQLRDWKGSVEIENADPESLHFYAGVCGHTLARGHARSGDPISIRAYVGAGDNLDRAVTAFAEAYAAQNLDDYELFMRAIKDGEIEADTSE